jgi:hypothetical protein
MNFTFNETYAGMVAAAAALGMLAARRVTSYRQFRDKRYCVLKRIAVTVHS